MPKPSSSSSYSLLYCTGHQDSGVRLWDMYEDVPVLLGVAPSAAAVAALEGKAQAGVVSTLEFAWEQGLLITGHEGGEVSGYLLGIALSSYVLVTPDLLLTGADYMVCYLLACFWLSFFLCLPV